MIDGRLEKLMVLKKQLKPKQYRCEKCHRVKPTVHAVYMTDPYVRKSTIPITVMLCFTCDQTLGRLLKDRVSQMREWGLITTPQMQTILSWGIVKNIKSREIIKKKIRRNKV